MPVDDKRNDKEMRIGAGKWNTEWTHTRERVWVCVSE